MPINTPSHETWANKPDSKLEHMSGDLVLEKTLIDIQNVQDRVTEKLHLEPGSAEAISATDEALVHIAESTIDSDGETAHSRADTIEDVIIESALEADYGYSLSRTPLRQLQQDGYGEVQAVTDVTAMIERLNPLLPSGHEVSGLLTEVVDSFRKDQRLDEAPSEVELIPHPPNVEVIPESAASRMNAMESYAMVNLKLPEFVKSVCMVSATNTERLNDINEAIQHSFSAPREAWQERVFGKAEVSELKTDALTRLETTVEQRTGESIMIEGVEKKPIMDISLDEEAKLDVAKTIAERQAGLVDVKSKLEDIKATGKTLSFAEYSNLMYDSKIRGRKHSNLIDGGGASANHNPGATIADLYTDDRDLALYDEIDALAGSVTNSSIQSSRENLAESIVQLAANSFPAGTELMHAIRTDTIADVVEHGSLSPRSQRKHGADVQSSSLNGAFIHMTGTGSVATEYGDSIVAGIPIETIMKHSPYMQLEDSYTNNVIERETGKNHIETHSMQYRMDKLHINNLASAPEAFRAAFSGMQAQAEKGIQKVNIEQGNLDNISFAAGSMREMAGAYNYPLSEISLYASDEGASALFESARQFGVVEEIGVITNVCASGPGARRRIEESGGSANSVLLSAAELPKPAISETGGITVYAPGYAQEVDFTEAKAGNSKKERSIPFSLETIKRSTVPVYLEGLVRDGTSPRETFDAALDAINDGGGRSDDLLHGYVGAIDTFVDAGITPTSLFEGLDEAHILGENLSDKNENILQSIHNLDEDPLPDTYKPGTEGYIQSFDTWNNKGHYATKEVKRELMIAYAKRLYEISPNAFAFHVPDFRKYDVPITDRQETEIRQYTARIEAERAAYVAPSYDNLTF